MEACDLRFYDKVDTKFSGWSEEQFKAAGVRVVPPAVARKGSFQAKGVILMPSYVNIGAYVDEGTMVDTWATVGSCAQIGKMYICRVVWALVVFLSHFKQIQPLLKITALSVHVQKSWKV